MNPVSPVTLHHRWGLEPLHAAQQGVLRALVLALLAMALAVFFWVLGAALVSALLAAQVLLVAAAFAHHAGHAADGETLCLQDGRLRVERGERT